MEQKKVDLSQYNNSWYKPGNPAKRILWYFINVVFFINPLFTIMSFKVFLLRLFGAKVGKGVWVKPGVNIKYPWFLEIGNYVWVGERVWIDNLGKVTIGDNVILSQGALLLCGSHDYKRESFDLMVGEITLQEGVWIGANSVVCPGVVCESHSVLAAGSVITSRMEAYKIYQGNPAIFKRIRVVHEGEGGK